MRLLVLGLAGLLAASAVGGAAAQPTIERTGAGAFPISSVVVVKGVGGADIAWIVGLVIAAALYVALMRPVVRAEAR